MLQNSDGLSRAQATEKKAELKKIATEFDMFDGCVLINIILVQALLMYKWCTFVRPMDPIQGIASDFWQYAVVKAPALSSLVKVKAYKSISCDKFPAGAAIGDKGRGPSSAFSTAEKEEFGIASEDC